MVVPDFTAKSAELRGDLYRACLAHADPGKAVCSIITVTVFMTFPSHHCTHWTTPLDHDLTFTLIPSVGKRYPPRQCLHSAHWTGKGNKAYKRQCLHRTQACLAAFSECKLRYALMPGRGDACASNIFLWYLHRSLCLSVSLSLSLSLCRTCNALLLRQNQAVSDLEFIVIWLIVFWFAFPDLSPSPTSSLPLPRVDYSWDDAFTGQNPVGRYGSNHYLISW